MRIVVTGASGQLGAYVIDDLIGGDHEFTAWSGPTGRAESPVALRPIELTDRRAGTAGLEEANPDVVIHLAAVSAAEAARRDPLKAAAVNVVVTQFLAEWCERHDRRLLYTSTDMVFDGTRSWYREEDPACPLGVYGQTKHAAERFVLEVPNGVVARLSLLHGPSRCGKDGFFDRTTAALRAGIPQTFFEDERRTALDYATAARIIVRLAENQAVGLFHVGGPERLSRVELMRRAAVALGIDPRLVRSNKRAEVPMAEPRPADLSLDSTRLRNVFPDLERLRFE